MFVSRKTGRRGIVIANYDETEGITARVSLDGGGTPNLYRLIDDPTWRRAAEGVVVPSCSAAVVVEQ